MSENVDSSGLLQLMEQFQTEKENLKKTQILDQTFKFLLKRPDQIPQLIIILVNKIDLNELMLCHWLLDRLPGILPHMKGKPGVNELIFKAMEILIPQFKHKRFPAPFLVQTSCFVIRFLMDQIRDNPQIKFSLNQPLRTLVDCLLNVPMTDMQVRVMMVKCFQTVVVSLSGTNPDFKIKAANPEFNNIPFHETSQKVLKYLEKGLSNDRSYNVLTAIINAFTIICLERPAYCHRILDIVMNFYNSPPSYLNSFQSKCVLKSIKVQIINLHKHNNNKQFGTKLTKIAEDFLRINSPPEFAAPEPYTAQPPPTTNQPPQSKTHLPRPPYPDPQQRNPPRPQRPLPVPGPYQQPLFKPNQIQKPNQPFFQQPHPQHSRGNQYIPRPPQPHHIRPPQHPHLHDFPPPPQFMHMNQPPPIPYPPHHEFPPEQFDGYPPYEEYDQQYYPSEFPPQEPIMDYDEQYAPYPETNYPAFPDDAIMEPNSMASGYSEPHTDHYPGPPPPDWTSHEQNAPPYHMHRQEFESEARPRSGPSTPPFAQSHPPPVPIVHESRQQNFIQPSSQEKDEFERPLPKQPTAPIVSAAQSIEQPIPVSFEPSATSANEPSAVESDIHTPQSSTIAPTEDHTDANTLVNSIPSSPSTEEVEEEFELTENWINTIKSLSFQRLLQKGTQITSKDKSNQLVGLDWMVLSSRIASLAPFQDDTFANNSGDLRRIIFDFICLDFKTNLPLMLNWLLEEFYKWGASEVDNKPTAYTYWLHRLLDDISPPASDIKSVSETKESKLVSPILLNIPFLTDHSFEWLWRWCESPQCTLTGFHCLRDLLYNRPAIRGVGLDKLLSYCICTDHLFRNAAIDTAQQLVVSCPSISEDIVTFAINTFYEITQVKVPNCLKSLEDLANEMKSKNSNDDSKEDQDQNDSENNANDSATNSEKNIESKKRNFEIASESEDEGKEEEEDPSQAKAKYDLEVIRRSELYCGIVAKKPELINKFLSSYNQSTSAVQDTLNRKLKALINELGGENEYLLESIQEFITTSPNLIFNILNTLVEKGNVADNLVITLKQIYLQGDLYELNWEFLDTVLPKMNKKQVYQFIPIIVSHIELDEMDQDKNRSKIQELLLTLLDPHKDENGNPKFKNPLTPVDLLIQLHILTEDDHVDKFNEAIQICINIQSTFNIESIAECLKSLVDQNQLPILLIKTMVKSVKVYSQLTSTVNGLLLKLVQVHCIWSSEQLWPEFIECCKLTTPQSFNVLLQLPKEQLEEVIVNHNDLLQGLAKHIKNKMNHNQQMRVYALLPMLDIRPSAPSKQGNKADGKDGTGKEKRHAAQSNKRQRADLQEGKSETVRDLSTDSKKSKTRGPERKDR